MNRYTFIKQTSLASVGLLFSKNIFSNHTSFPVVRVPLNERKFHSPAVEQIISSIEKNIGNKELAWMFGNCFPNTLDTTVDFEIINGKPDTYVITGDIDAMWLRDSSAQVWPYLRLVKEDSKLRDLIKGVINRQVKCLLLDPYANAFYKDTNKISEWKSDLTEMKPGIHERKWELDSPCYAIRLAHGYWKETGDTSCFDNEWKEAMRLVIKTMKQQQRMDGDGPYKFQRTTSWATDGVAMNGYGYPGKANGLITSVFRPSDDATIFPYLIPSNFFAVLALEQLAQLMMLPRVNEVKFANEINALRQQVKKALDANAFFKHPQLGNIIAYEVNGFGSINFMDDSNVPSLLSLPYLGAISATHPSYLQTRKLLLSEENPFFYKGKYGGGTGSPHTLKDNIWPMGIIIRGLTSHDSVEIKNCLTMLQNTHAGTGFMHESFNKNNAAEFTRKWFAWANTLFGEFVWEQFRERRAVLG